MSQKYVLGFSIGQAVRGDVITFDPEWTEWTLNGTTYNYRTSIGNGEVAMVLNFCREHHLSTLLRPFDQAMAKGEDHGA